MERYTREFLKEQYSNHLQYALLRKKAKERIRSIRLPIVPEDISENAIRFAIHTHEKESDVSWDCSGDLYSPKLGKIECKCFTSDGPISFTPSSSWNILYFLDARQWIDDRYRLYRVDLDMKSEEWRRIMVNKTETFEIHANQGRRPRIGWESLQKQIVPSCKLIYEGGFEQLVGK